MDTSNLDDKTIYLVDGSGYIFRAFFAIRHLRSKSGMPTNAIFGFAKMLLKLLKEHNPKYIAIAFDTKTPNFRHQLFKEYKANRPAPPEDLVVQFEWIHKLVKYFGIKNIAINGLEADDIIAILNKKAKNLGFKVVIVTADKDFMQLVDENTFLLDELRASKNNYEQFIDAKTVKEELGVWPNQVIDLLALMGDSSDNIPGVSGIGRKTAQELLEKFDSLDNIFNNLDLITQNAKKEKLKIGQEMALLSRKLVSLDDTSYIPYEISDLEFLGISKQELEKFFVELDFSSLKKELSTFKEKHNFIQGVQQDLFSFVEPIKYNIQQQIINSQESFNNLINKMNQADIVSIDVHTDTLDSMKSTLIGIYIAINTSEYYYIDINQNLTLNFIQNSLNIFFNLPVKIIIPNAKFVSKILLRHGFKNFCITEDPLIASYLLYQDQTKHNLDELSEKFLSYSIKNIDKESANISLKLNEQLKSLLKNEALEDLYNNIEMPLIKVLVKMELNGVKINTEILNTLKESWQQKVNDLEKKAFELALENFNLASPKQVSQILFEKLKLKTAKKTKTGFSTDVTVLESLKDQHPLVEILLEHRSFSKLISTYGEALIKLVDPNTSRVHTSYNQMITATGRLSSTDPNLQNIPIKTAEGRKIRQAFIAENNNLLISLDYSQMELRLLAFVTQDPSLLESFALNQDVHAKVASEIFSVALEHVTKEQRNIAKTINFGLLYGMGSGKLAQTLKISTALAKNYLEKYFSKYQRILQWKEETLKNAHQTLEVRTLFSRKRELKDLASHNHMLKARAERLAINTPIQGSAADIMKKVMIKVDSLLEENYPQAKLIMQVHDELVIEVPKNQAQEIALKVAHIMENDHELGFNLKVDYSIGENWDF